MSRRTRSFAKQTIYGLAHSLTGTNAMKFKKESVKEFYIRIEKTAHELTHKLTVDKEPIEANIIAQTLQAHALNLSVFLTGISQSIE